jgi:hypothetical protein
LPSLSRDDFEKNILTDFRYILLKNIPKVAGHNLKMSTRGSQEPV